MLECALLTLTAKGRKMNTTLEQLNNLIQGIEECLLLPEYDIDNAIFEIEVLIARLESFRDSLITNTENKD